MADEIEYVHRLIFQGRSQELSKLLNERPDLLKPVLLLSDLR